MFRKFFDHLEAVWRQLEQASALERVVLAMTTVPSIQTELRIFSIQERWHILFTRSLAGALQFNRLHKITVILYDLDLPGEDWRKAIRSLANRTDPVFLILMSPVADQVTWRAVLDQGGYDVVAKPIHRSDVVRVVNGAFALASSLETVSVERSRL